jgi:APA family basic amino acid/polyamine antiporter
VAAGLVDISTLGQLTSMGTLLAFVIVCGGVLILRYRAPELPRPFRTPGMPWVPILGMLICFYLMVGLPIATWIRLVVWLTIGMLIYVGYAYRNLRRQEALKQALGREPHTRELAR